MIGTNKVMNKIAVITGANGMDAKTLTHFLLNKGYTIILTYRRNSYFDIDNIKNIFRDDLIKNVTSKLMFDVCDISCQNSVIECIKSILKLHNKIDEVYHLAAMSHVGNSFKQKELSILVNGQSNYYFLEALKEYSPSTRYYGAMTSELVGGMESGVFNENCKWHPRSPYAIGKALGARWIDFYRESSDLNMFCCYGILFNHSNCYRSSDFFIRKITSAAAKISVGKLQNISLGNLNFWRDEHWSDFGCEMMWKILQLKVPDNFVIGTGQAHHGEEYLDLTFKYFNLDWKKYVKFDENLIRPNEVIRLVSDSSKAQKILKWSPNRISFEDHLKLMCKYDYETELNLNPTIPNVFDKYPIIDN